MSELDDIRKRKDRAMQNEDGLDAAFDLEEIFDDLLRLAAEQEAELSEANAEAAYLRSQILRINRIHTTGILSEQVEVLATEIERAINGNGFDTPIRNYKVVEHE